MTFTLANTHFKKYLIIQNRSFSHFVLTVKSFSPFFYFSNFSNAQISERCRRSCSSY